MGIYIGKIKNYGNLIKIDSEVFSKLYPKFEVESVTISISKDELKELIKQEENHEHREVFEEMLDEMGSDNGGDFTIS